MKSEIIDRPIMIATDFVIRQNLEYLECIFGEVRSTNLTSACKYGVVGYTMPCDITCPGPDGKYNSSDYIDKIVGLHICPDCGQVFVVTPCPISMSAMIGMEFDTPQGRPRGNGDKLNLDYLRG